jgi:hypothetical protein
MNMDIKLKVSGKFRIAMIVMIVIGIIAIVTGFFSGDAHRTWANLLLNNFYFLSLAIGATFWMAMQAITQSGWSSSYLRIPQAMSMYIMVSFVLWLFMFFGLHDLYHWTHPEALEHDAILLHKAPYLNVPFFTVRFAVFFALWIFLTLRIRSLSIKEDLLGGTKFFEKIEFSSKVLIFVLAFSFSLFAIDWLMSLDAHWYSTIYAVKKFVSAFLHGTAVITAIAVILHMNGYLPQLTKSHKADFSRYIFALSIIWGYMWFSQYMLIWYANIPEETVYYVPRIMTEYKELFYAELLLNWLVPFIFLMWNKVGKTNWGLLSITGVLIIGQWIELYMSIMPGTVDSHSIGYLEIGSFIGFTGLFALVVATALSKANLIPKKHPYLMESLHDDH